MHLINRNIYFQIKYGQYAQYKEYLSDFSRYFFQNVRKVYLTHALTKLSNL